MKMRSKAPRPGRPRAFDEDAALEKAMQVFWRKGYDSASVSDLTKAMGINPPSLYAAFGNKEELFFKVLQKYGEGPAAYVMKALAEPTARAVAERRLNDAVESMCEKKHPAGCLAVQAVARRGDCSDTVGRKLVTFCDSAHQAFIDRFKRAKAEGDLPPDADPTVLARFVTTLAQGLSLQVAGGASRTELRAVVKLALENWPE